jgi:hypothetical protein
MAGMASKNKITGIWPRRLKSQLPSLSNECNKAMLKF